MRTLNLTLTSMFVVALALGCSDSGGSEADDGTGTDGADDTGGTAEEETGDAEGDGDGDPGDGDGDPGDGDGDPGDGDGDPGDGDGDPGDGDGDGDKGCEPVDDTPCAVCTAEMCCPEITECEADETCSCLLECQMIAIDPNQCGEMCEVQPEGNDQFLALRECRFMNCQMECSGGGGGG